jgi:exonuclease VII small subunit
MNNSRRKRITESITSLKEAKSKMEQALKEEKLALEKVPNDDEYDDMRWGMDDIISGLEDTISNLEDALNSLECIDL